MTFTQLPIGSRFRFITPVRLPHGEILSGQLLVRFLGDLCGGDLACPSFQLVGANELNAAVESLEPADRRAPTIYILALARTFPCLASKLPDWEPAEFDPNTFWNMTARWSHGEALCAIFLLNVWNPGYAKGSGWHFNVFDFLALADRGNRDAFLAWARYPYFP